MGRRFGAANANPGKSSCTAPVLLIAIAAVFVITFLPTFLFDFVPMDQWRAFRYSLEDQGWQARLSSCVNMLPPFYVATGRPLVWQGECLEHSFVGRIADFRWLRPLCFTLVLATLFVLSQSLRGLVTDPPVAYVVAAVALYSPSYCFMYYQGLTGAPVLVAAILGIVSYSTFMRRGEFRVRLAAVVMIVAADFIFPVFAAAGIAVALLYAIFDRSTELLIRARRFAMYVAIYVIASIVYFGTSKLVVLLYFSRNPQRISVLTNVAAAHYGLQISTSALALIMKVGILAKYFWSSLPLSSFFNVPGVLKVGILLAMIVIGAGTDTSTLSRVDWRRLLSGAIIMCIGLLVMVTPWLVSGFDELFGRYLMTWCLLMAGGVVLIADRLTAMAHGASPYKRACMVAFFVFLPASVRHLKSTMDQVRMSEGEVRQLRNGLNDVVQSAKLAHIHRIHVVRPVRIPVDETHTPASAANPEHIYQMTTAILRELLPESQLRQIKIHDCRFNQACGASVTGGIALTQSERIEDAETRADIPVIDLRTGHSDLLTVGGVISP